MNHLTNVLTGETRCGALARRALLLLACFAAVSHACADAPSADARRFLFIVDASLGMKRIEEPLRQSMFDLIYSGVRGRMTNGDTYGVWLVNDTNNTSLPMETWKHKFAVEIAAKAALRIEQHGLKGKARLDLALADAGRVVRAVEDVTVILISNGETPLKGTPFDSEINAAFAKLAPAMRAAKATLNTTLVAQEGKFVAWAVNSPDFLIEVPQVPPRNRPKALARSESPSTAPAVAAAETRPAAAGETAPTNAPVRVASKPIIITRETVDRERAVTKALASTQLTNETAESLLLAAVTNPDSTGGPILPPAGNTLVPNESSLNTPTAPPVAPTPTNAMPAPSQLAPAWPASNTVTQTAPADTVAWTAATETEETTNSLASAGSPVQLLVEPTLQQWIGAAPAGVFWGLGAALAAVLFLAARSFRRERVTQPSLISQAVALERLRNR